MEMSWRFFSCASCVGSGTSMCVSAHLVGFQYHMQFCFCSLYYICIYGYSGFGQNCVKLQKLAMKMKLLSFTGLLHLTFSKFFESSCSVFWHLLRNVLLCNKGIKSRLTNTSVWSWIHHQMSCFSDRLCLNSPPDQAVPILPCDRDNGQHDKFMFFVCCCSLLFL